MAKLETFSDAFNHASLSASWTPFTAGSATLSYAATGAQCNFPASTSSSTDGDITSASTYDLTNSYGYLQVVGVPSTSTHTDCTFSIRSSTSNSVQWQWESGQLFAEYIVSGTQTSLGSLTYSATTHKWWRIREGTGGGGGGTAGNTYWDTSADGVTWTQRFTHATPITVTALNVNIAGTCFGIDSNNTPFKWNNLNIIPAVGKDMGPLNNTFGAMINQAVSRANNY